MNTIQFTKDKIPFTMVANDVLTDSRLSAKAKGLYAYLYSKPDGWEFAIKRIKDEMSDKDDSIEKGLQELELLGLLTRKKKPTGKMLYMIHFPPIYPIAENRHQAIANRRKTQSGKIGAISNIEWALPKCSISSKTHTKKESVCENETIEKVLNLIYITKNKAFSEKERLIYIKRYYDALIEISGYEKSKVKREAERLTAEGTSWNPGLLLSRLIS